MRGPYRSLIVANDRPRRTSEYSLIASRSIDLGLLDAAAAKTDGPAVDKPRSQSDAALVPPAPTIVLGARPGPLLVTAAIRARHPPSCASRRALVAERGLCACRSPGRDVPTLRASGVLLPRAVLSIESYLERRRPASLTQSISGSRMRISTPRLTPENTVFSDAMNQSNARCRRSNPRTRLDSTRLALATRDATFRE